MPDDDAPPDRVPRRLLGLALLLSVTLLVDVALRATGTASDLFEGTVAFPDEFVVGVAITLPFLAGVWYAGYWLPESDLEPRRYRRIWRWTVVGTAGSLAVNLALILVFPGWPVLLVAGWLRWAIAVGAGLGVAIGVTEARSIQHAANAERSAVRAEQLEVQRDLLDYLNGLLRHEVLNAANVISGYAELLAEDLDADDPRREQVATIQRKSAEVTDVVKDVRALLHATEGRADLEPTDVGQVLEREIRKLRDTYPSVTVDADVPEDVFVPGDVLLPRVFSNLLSNAVEHNDSDPHVWVRVDATDDRVVVDVEDDGPGVPEAERGSLFDRPAQRRSDHGFGLYLVDRLVEHYGGSVELADTGPEGSTFRVVLPYVRDDEDVSQVARPLPFTEATRDPQRASE